MRRVSVVATMLGVLVMGVDAGASSRGLLLDDAGSARLAVAQRGPVSLAQARDMALQRFPGRAVRSETVTSGNRTVHEIRILDSEGRVRNVRIDAQTGSFL